jgi:hypothetical protein
MSSVDLPPTKSGNEKLHPAPQQPSSTTAPSTSSSSVAPKTRLGLVPGENIKEKQVNFLFLFFMLKNRISLLFSLKNIVSYYVIVYLFIKKQSNLLRDFLFLI